MSDATRQLALGALLSVVKQAWTKWNEVMLNIDTRSIPRMHNGSADSPRPWYRSPASDKAEHDDAHSTASPDYWYVRKVFRIVKPRPTDVIYDVGSGTGRIVCVVSRRRLRKCVGVELFEPLCDVARKNASQLRGKKSPIEIICDDAARANMSDGTIYFLFNPFGPGTMRDFIRNVYTSLSSNPRAITIIYYNAVYESILEAEGWLERYRHFHTARGLSVSFWRSPPLRGKLDGVSQSRH